MPIKEIFDNKYVNELKSNGITVIPFLDLKELEKYHKDFLEETTKFPEYISPDYNELLVKGGFGALGNPSSFHNNTIRQLRLQINDLAIKFFQSFQENNTKPRNLEQLFDRFSLRTKGSSTTAESWHRDIAPLKEKFQDDIVFGGWINLDLNKDQYFSCVMNTHLDEKETKGFALEKDQKSMEKKYRPLSTKIKCPPGHWIVFYQNILHEVLKITQKHGYSMKQYFGWRLTYDIEPLFNNLDEIIENQGCPKIPSGQQPWMYGPSHLQFFQQDLIKWSEKMFKPICLEEKINRKTGNNYKIVKRFLPSLKEMNLPMYEKYSIEEIILMKPQKI
jgi:hypothetical protein